MPQQPKRFTAANFDTALAELRLEQSGGIMGASPDDFNTAPTPQELHAIYSQGFRGLKPETATFEERVTYKNFIAAQPRLYEAFPWAQGLGKGKISCPYLAALHFSPSWGSDEAQTRGDCTVHGTGNSAEQDPATDALFGETEYKGRLCKENIYRSRGFNTDGWSCEAPCHYIGPEGKGGLLYRKVYEGPNGETVDLSKYNPSWEGNGRAGVPSWLEELSRQNKVKWVILITTMEEYRDAIAMGFGINVCSGQGFSDATDDYGVATARGSWSHSMGHASCLDTDWARSKYGDMIGGIQQSWGKWNQQNGKPEGVPVMATGQFYSKASTIASMLRGQDSFAMCGVWGWERSSWEAFDVTDLKTHLSNSTTQDYYKHRAEKAAEYVTKKYDEFLSI